jgi:hypothetical protein
MDNTTSEVKELVTPVSHVRNAPSRLPRHQKRLPEILKLTGG